MLYDYIITDLTKKDLIDIVSRYISHIILTNEKKILDTIYEYTRRVKDI